MIGRAANVVIVCIANSQPTAARRGERIARVQRQKGSQRPVEQESCPLRHAGDQQSRLARHVANADDDHATMNGGAVVCAITRS
jgi:hypothetical protein